MTPAAVARALGGDVVGRDTILCPGPGHSKRDRSLAVKLDPRAPDGILVFSHASDDWRACRDDVRSRLGLPPWQPGDEQRRSIPQSRVVRWDMAATDAEADEPVIFTDEQRKSSARALAIWNEATDPRGTSAEKWLREQRGLAIDDEIAGHVLRFNARTPWRDENTGQTIFVPALIALFRSIDTTEPVAVHRIRFAAGERKPDRRMLGPVGRAAVMLGTVTDGRLAIAEGVETAMAARQLGIGCGTWALGSVGAISRFPVLPTVKHLTFCGETGDACKQAMRWCGLRWRKAGRRVTIVMPEVGSDLNDEIIARRHAAV
jgi:putative DNA primase/helicase